MQDTISNLQHCNIRQVRDFVVRGIAVSWGYLSVEFTLHSASRLDKFSYDTKRYFYATFFVTVTSDHQQVLRNLLLSRRWFGRVGKSPE